ncbi:hypothetical protein GTR04_7551 [Trichophyton interdigitale]|nr:hypothetical protein GY631_7405 [Trichophyton interdigitale]KAG8205067.1 hypothetical protein GTR04_7551 [Trichophyton interdigitale]
MKDSFPQAPTKQVMMTPRSPSSSSTTTTTTTKQSTAAQAGPSHCHRPLPILTPLSVQLTRQCLPHSLTSLASPPFILN